MRLPLISLAALLGLSGCVMFGGSAEETPASTMAARAVVAPIVATQVPGPVGESLTDCIIENATEAELATLAVANAGAPGEAATALVSEILARDATVACAASSIAPASA